jgi:acyl-CoA dehydrogenase
MLYSFAVMWIAIVIVVFIATLMTLVPLRRVLFSSWIMRLVGRVLPVIGETERIALEAGTVWWEGELFSGKPDWQKLLDFPKATLSPEERAFLDGPTEKLCQMLNDWEIRQHGDLPPDIWRFIKEQRFLGIIIPKTFGGLEMSALAHSAIITKIASRSITAAVTVMVPNSLGPGELLLHYGTEVQKNYYLPRLARGEEIPCFGLTEPEAGSDAASLQSRGVLCMGTYDNREVLGIKLNWSKRYITLGPVATVMGLAFRLLDPHHLTGEKEDLGITCALIPTHLPGITIGSRHDPMGIPFQNGPNAGHDVFIPADFIIGGLQMVGQGWKMLMQSLAAGRSISLPALSVAEMQHCTRVVGAYATVREQFNLPIGKFEGIEEVIARIAGLTYISNAARVVTAGAVDTGQKPAVVSAIAKAYLTETMRKVVADAMDIQAGAAICRGPHNILEAAFLATPIGITVEGANILTRTLIIYGQGAIRCHPFVQKEMAAIVAEDKVAFDNAFFGHIGFVCKNAWRTLAHGLTSNKFASAPNVKGLRLYYQQLARLSAAFAFLSDVAMATLGGSLKKRESLSGRFADALAWMYLASCALKRFSDDGEKPEHLVFVKWSCEHAIFLVQQSLRGIVRNFPNRAIGRVLGWVIFPLGSFAHEPRDKLGAQLARAVCDNSAIRHQLSADVFTPSRDEIGMGQLELAFEKVTAARIVEKKIQGAIQSGALPKGPPRSLLELAREQNIISTSERDIVLEAIRLRDAVIAVDAFADLGTGVFS